MPNIFNLLHFKKLHNVLYPQSYDQWTGVIDISIREFVYLALTILPFFFVSWMVSCNLLLITNVDRFIH